MNRRGLLALVTTLAFGAAGPAFADYVDQVRTQLQAQGYQQISISDTLLGRSRLLAKGNGGTREIIMNPRTGEILRDMWLSGQGTTGPSIGGSETAPGNVGGGNAGGDDGGDDGSGHDSGDGGDSGDGDSGDND